MSLSDSVASEAVGAVDLSTLPEAAALGQGAPPRADMQPALALADGGRHVTLHAFQVQIDLLLSK